MKIAIAGSGFAGLAMAIRLKRAGENDFVIFERAAGIGGTWRANCYPGAACDIESPLYSFSFAPNPNWSRMFSPQEEILAYLETCVRKFDLAGHLRLSNGIKEAHFENDTWHFTSDDGEQHDARALIIACGGLSQPALPEIAGLQSFHGPMFHSARWDKTANLAGKRIGIIGTGASAIQIVPELAKIAERLFVFQRTPPWILPRADRAFGDEEKRQFAAAPWRQRLLRSRLYCRHELLAVAFTRTPWLLALAGRYFARQLRRHVADPALREKLTPRYTLGCKRVLLSNDYYSAMHRANVALVTSPIDHVDAAGVQTREQHVPLDVLVLATGFHAADAIAPFSITARGRSLDEAWQGGAEAYLGTTVNGFPNLFVLVGPNTALGHSSMILQIESQVNYVLGALAVLEKNPVLEVREEVQREFNERLHAHFPHTVWSSGCVSWYQTKNGKNTTIWPGFTFSFRSRTKRFDSENYSSR